MDNGVVKLEPNVAFDETISNNIVLDIVNGKRTNVVISSYTITIHEGNPMHIYSGEDHIFMKSDSVEYRTKLNGIKQLQSDYNGT